MAVALDGADGVIAHFHNPNDHSGTGYSERLEVDLPAHGSTTVHLALTGLTADAFGRIHLILTTDLGGQVEKDVAYRVTGTGGGCPPDGHHMTGAMEMGACSTTGASESKGSPGIPIGAAVAALAVAGLARRVAAGPSRDAGQRRTRRS